MKTIHKTTVPISSAHTVRKIPGKIIHVGIQQQNRYDLTIWYEFDEEKPYPLRDRTFFVHGTGWSIPADQRHVGTVLVGDFVWHLYEGAEALQPTVASPECFQ